MRKAGDADLGIEVGNGDADLRCLGGHLVAVPYDSLVIDDEGSKIQLPGASKDELRKLPELRYRS